jgi:signal transduction histidine kinase
MAKSSLHFSVHPSVVYQLGESLISDAMQAIIELVKNSYDADASYSKVVIDTQGVTKPDDSYFKNEEGGIITIEDDGCGMSLDDLEKGWLTISNRRKLEVKRRKEITKKGRTPLGDKGLGRLGVQKLGKNIEIYTKKRGETGHHIGFSWLDFSRSEKLENVEIQLDEITYHKASGTKIVISSLKEPELWKDEKEKQEGKKKKNNKQVFVIERLKKELSLLVSPYKEIRDFTVYIEIDNKVIDLIEISNLLLNNALLRYRINFDGNNLLISGNAKLDYFLPSTSKKEEKEVFQRIVRKDYGEKFFKFLEQQGFARENMLTRSKTKKWFIDFKYKRVFTGIDKIEYINGKIANPGPFWGEVNAFNLNFYDDEQHIFDQKSEYKQIIKDVSGIRVYRDGFAIRVDQDWLGLGKQQTTGSSFYGLRPLNTLGYISLTARDNINLEETTDREGFKDTLYYRNFFLLLKEFIKFTGTIQENIRRSCTEFLKEYQELNSGIDVEDAIEDITQPIKKVLADAPNYKKNIDSLKNRISKNIRTSSEVVEDLADSKETSFKLRERAVTLINQIKLLLDDANNVLACTEKYLSELNSLKDFPGVIEGRIADLRRQMEIMYESVALGLTAEALSHEINNITDQLAGRSKIIKVDLSKRNITDKNILEFIEYVRSAVIALQKQMSFLSPTLRYVREKRSEINISAFINEIIAYFENRWENNSISIKAYGLENNFFTVKINKGKLIQIIDNLILNSEYWLKEDIKQEKIKKGIVGISISPPYITISDNGRGIDPSVELTLFDPFVSTKANGRGLGLFIVKQLLASEGCDIILLPDRNKKKKLFKFQIDLEGIINE